MALANTAYICSGTTLSFKGQLVRLINSLNQSIISIGSTGISRAKAVNVNNNSVSSLTALTASGNVSVGSVTATGNVSSSTTTTNTLTTAGVVLNSKG